MDSTPKACANCGKKTEPLTWWQDHWYCPGACVVRRSRVKSTMKPGFYSQKDARGSVTEIYHVTGKKTGNAYYNPWADKPRWAGMAPQFLPGEEELRKCDFSETNPMEAEAARYPPARRATT